jgi:hypothetical protein
MKPCAWPVLSGSPRCRNVNSRSRSTRSERAAFTSAASFPSLIVTRSMLGHERSNSENLVLAANSATFIPALCSHEKTEPTACPAAFCTVLPLRSVFQVTPWPACVRSIRRPVTMLVWFGRVRVDSTWVRALSVDAPSEISRWKFGVPSVPSWRNAVGLSPSMEITRTRVSGADAPPGVPLRAGPGAGATSAATSAMAGTTRRTTTLRTYPRNVT